MQLSSAYKHLAISTVAFAYTFSIIEVRRIIGELDLISKFATVRVYWAASVLLLIPPRIATRESPSWQYTCFHVWRLSRLHFCTATNQTDSLYAGDVNSNSLLMPVGLFVLALISPTHSASNSHRPLSPVSIFILICLLRCFGGLWKPSIVSRSYICGRFIRFHHCVWLCCITAG